MIFVSAAVSGMGLTCILMRKSLLGVVIGIQIMMLGAAMAFVASQRAIEGNLVGLLIVFSLLPHLTGGFALIMRLFYLKKSAGMNDVQTLKN